MTYVTTKELEQKYKLSAMTIWRYRKEGMPFEKLGNGIRFDEEKVHEWLRGKGVANNG
jgi:predicted DNA-binding transcriptional regulator AlpA